MHTAQTGRDGLVVSVEAIQKNRATANHHHGSQDQANRANDGVDAHTDVSSYQQQAKAAPGLLQFDHLQVDTVLSWSTKARSTAWTSSPTYPYTSNHWLAGPASKLTLPALRIISFVSSGVNSLVVLVTLRCPGAMEATMTALAVT